MTKKNLRNKLDGNQLDLSLSGMTVVPVKELASIPKATRLDLSCNQILSLPDAFCDLSHLIKLDLSKNMIQSLPDEFGNLVKLQQLDLYNNQLKTLPLSFSKLKHLQWLDLKNNPLEPHLQSAAGDCLDEKECKLCAKRVVAVMCQMAAEHERQEALKVETEKVKEEEKKLAEERELEKIRNNKKLEKLKKRQKYEASQRLKMKKETKKDVPKEKESLPASNGLPSKKYIQPKNSRPKCYTGLVITICATIFAVIIGIYLYCSNSPTKAACEDMWKTFKSTKDKLMIFMKKYISL